MTDVMASTPEFNFDSTCTTPYASAPSSPRGFGNLYYTSAPASPSSAAAFYSPFYSPCEDGQGPAGDDRHEDGNENDKNDKNDKNENEDFAFEFSGQLVMGADEDLTATADELFEAGKIRPFKPPSRLQVGSFDCSNDGSRGRERVKLLEKSTGRGSRRVTRSLSPLRGDHSDVFRGKSSTPTATTSTVIAATATAATPTIKSMSCKKWRLMDFFLFRSASEGRVTGRNGKDPLQKYTAVLGTSDQHAKSSTSSFRSMDCGSVSSRRAVRREGSGSAGRSSRRGVTAHELHYASNRAQSEEMRKKTFLPYRQGLLGSVGCLGFNPSLNGVAKAFGSFVGSPHR